MTKFGFKIRTRSGLVVDNLLIPGKDQADAERKLNQIYRHCEILESKSVQQAGRDEALGHGRHHLSDLPAGQRKGFLSFSLRCNCGAKPHAALPLE